MNCFQCVCCLSLRKHQDQTKQHTKMKLKPKRNQRKCKNHEFSVWFWWQSDLLKFSYCQKSNIIYICILSISLFVCFYPFLFKKSFSCLNILHLFSILTSLNPSCVCYITEVVQLVADLPSHNNYSGSCTLRFSHTQSHKVSLCKHTVHITIYMRDEKYSWWIRVKYRNNLCT